MLRVVVLSVVLLFSHSVWTKSESPLTIAVGLNKPPYTIEHNRSGFDLDLVRAIMARAGYRIEPVFVPFGLAPRMLIEGEVDGAITQSPSVEGTQPYLTKPYITYQNVAISLSSRDIELEGISQLSDYGVVAFQRADVILGEDYARAVSQSPVYTELAKQQQQVRMLLDDRTDVVVMDVNIFNYLAKKWWLKPLEKVDVHYLFPATPYAMGLRDDKVRQAFNQVLPRYKRSQDYRQLLEQYEFIQQEGPQPVTEKLWDF